MITFSRRALLWVNVLSFFHVKHNALHMVQRLGGLVVSVLATGPKVRGFKTGRG
jgi:hypothetical protein